MGVVSGPKRSVLEYASFWTKEGQVAESIGGT